MHVVTEEIRRYIITGAEREYPAMLDFVKGKQAKVVKEIRNERVRHHKGVVLYAERLCYKPRRRSGGVYVGDDTSRVSRPLAGKRTTKKKGTR